ncbi:hypothetical protein L3X38_032685 [Prunus dulcis]|uniref:Integrase zinc-binding domain-containing protein n=1 Tax=Prunus dulcis TaxID=3755 RepID=A0AAD4VET4_PRUDU|nr:hypothetical protein L3X38_032685 [Prunus dulcis]
MEKLGKGTNIKDLKDYAIIFAEIYRRLPGGILTRCIGMTEARRILQEVHDATCSLEPVISLYRRLQRKGYYWPELKKQTTEIQSNWPTWFTTPSTKESFTISLAVDWRAPYLAFFVDWTLPTNSKLAYKLKKTVNSSDAISPVEITIPTARVSAVNDLEWDAKSCSDWRLLDPEAMDKKRVEAERKMALYHKLLPKHITGPSSLKLSNEEILC